MTSKYYRNCDATPELPSRQMIFTLLLSQIFILPIVALSVNLFFARHRYECNIASYMLPYDLVAFG